MKQRYIIKKRVVASSMEEALKLEKKVQPEEVWIDEKQPESAPTTRAIGFEIQ